MGQSTLVMQMGDAHKINRRIVSQAFQPRALQSYVSDIDGLTKHYLSLWESKKEFNMHEELKEFTLHIACKLFLDIDKHEKNFANFYETWGAGLLSVPINLPFTTYGKAMIARNNILKALDSIITDKTSKVSNQFNLIELLSKEDEYGNKLSLDDLKEQLLTLIFAGHESLSSALTSCCMILSKYPEVKQDLHNEILQQSDKTISIESFKKMPVIEKFIKEVLRVNPPSNLAPRKVLKTCQFGGYTIPSGWNITYSIVESHFDEQYFKESRKFNIENLDQNSLASDRYSYIPFGAGIRECIGREFAKLEIKIFLVNIIRFYDWNVKNPYSYKRKVLFPTIYPRDRLPVCFWRKQV
jgi:cytochrome P450